MLVKSHDGGCLIEVWLQPRASTAKIVGLDDRGLRVAVTSPPVEGRANDELVKLIAELLGVARTRVSIRSGRTGRFKTVQADGVPADMALEKIEEATGSSKRRRG